MHNSPTSPDLPPPQTRHAGASARKLLQGEPVPISEAPVNDTAEPVQGGAAAATAINQFGDALFEVLASQVGCL